MSYCYCSICTSWYVDDIRDAWHVGDICDTLITTRLIWHSWRLTRWWYLRHVDDEPLMTRLTRPVIGWHLCNRWHLWRLARWWYLRHVDDICHALHVYDICHVTILVCSYVISCWHVTWRCLSACLMFYSCLQPDETTVLTWRLSRQSREYADKKESRQSWNYADEKGFRQSWDYADEKGYRQSWDYADEKGFRQSWDYADGRWSRQTCPRHEHMQGLRVQCHRHFILRIRTSRIERHLACVEPSSFRTS